MPSTTATLVTGSLAGLASLGMYCRNRMIEDAAKDLKTIEHALDAGSCSHPANNGSMAIVTGVLPEALYSRTTTYKEVFQWTRFLKAMLGFGSDDEAEWTQIPVSSSTTKNLPLTVVTTGADGNHDPVVLRLNRPASELALCHPRALTASTREESVSSASLVRPEGGRFTKVETLAKATAVTFMARISYSDTKGWYVPAMEPVKWLTSSSLRDRIRGLKSKTALTSSPRWLWQGLGCLSLGLVLYGFLSPAKSD